MKKLILGLSLLFSGGAVFSQVNTSCAEMDPICTDVGLSFTAQANAPNASVTDPGNDYGCLFSQPNPTWYYFEVSTAGLIDMQLFAPSDIDFIIWGPFSDLATAQSYCGVMGVDPNAPEVDCSYSSTNNENPVIPNAQVGEVYVMLITNYANQVQNIDLTLNGNSTGETDCSIVQPDPCVADAGTFTYKINNQFIQGNEAVLCPDDDFEMISNLDYTLPNDTVQLSQGGDGVWNAEMMYLIYNAAPTSLDPNVDPGFLGIQHIKVGNSYGEANSSGNYILDNFGCGRYWIVPTPGDDGLTVGDVNGAAHWDKNGNGCYDLDTAAAFKLTFTCPIDAAMARNCDGTLANNGVDFTITGGLPAIAGGNYIVTNVGAGVLSSNSTANGGTVTVTGLSDGDIASIQVTDANGCQQTFDFTFEAPGYSVVITPGSTCGGAATNNGDITVTGAGNSGPFTIAYTAPSANNGASPLTLSSLFAGDAVSFEVADNAGCVTPGDTTIGSQDHFILTQIISQDAESCPGACDGAAEITAVPVDGSLNPDGATITSILLNGNSVAVTNPIELTGLCAGPQLLELSDDFGCDVSVPFTIGSPDPIVITNNNFADPTCYGTTDGSIANDVTGGELPYTMSWSHDLNLNNNVAELIGAGTYMMWAEDANGCRDSIEITLDQPDSLWFNLTLKDVICHGDSTGWAYIANSDIFGAQGAVTIFWSTFQPNGVNVNPVSNLYSGSHTVQIFDDNACESEQQFVINDPLLLEIQTISSIPSYCRGNSTFPGSGTVSGTANGGTGTIQYMWVGDGNGDGVVDTAYQNTWGNKVPGWYNLYAIDDNGCTVTDSIYVDSLNPIANFTANPTSGTVPVTVTVTDLSENRTGNTWQFFGPNGEQSEDSDIFPYDSLQAPFDTTFTVDGQHAICLVVSNDYACYDTMCVNLDLFPVPDFIAPNVFTPNGDGNNDEFFFPVEGIQTLSAIVVNRWGNQVFEFKSPDDKWNGQVNNTGAKCANGVYTFTYRAVAQNGTEFTGNGFVHLISK